MAVNNNVTLIGRLTKDVELRKTPTGLSVAQITVACNKKTNGEKEADFINCVVWKQSAEYLHTYAKKGTLVALNGRIQTRSYDNQQGQKVYITEVVAEQVTILASSNSSTSTSNQVQTTQAPKVEDSYSVELDICEDDLPF